MKTVFIVIGWYTGEDDFISGVFENKSDADSYAYKLEQEDEYNYQYKVEKWELQ